MRGIFVAILALFGGLLASSSPVPSGPRKPSYHPDKPTYEPPKHKGMPYAFAYEVIDPASDANFGHRESSDGYLVEGEYRVLLPDGRTQIVT